MGKTRIHFFTLDKKIVKPRKKCHMILSERSDYEVMVVNNNASCFIFRFLPDLEPLGA